MRWASLNWNSLKLFKSRMDYPHPPLQFSGVVERPLWHRKEELKRLGHRRTKSDYIDAWSILGDIPSAELGGSSYSLGMGIAINLRDFCHYLLRAIWQIEVVREDEVPRDWFANGKLRNMRWRDVRNLTL